MKKLVTIIFAAVLLAGCKSSYDVTLNNGMQFTDVSKPKLVPDKNLYVFKNASGRTYTIPEARVRAIEPHEKATKAKFSNLGGNDFQSSGR